MNVWIFFVSAVFTPIMEPLGLMTPALEAAAVVEAPWSQDDLVTVPLIEPAPPTVLDHMRYPGIERMFARLEADE